VEVGLERGRGRPRDSRSGDRRYERLPVMKPRPTAPGSGPCRGGTTSRKGRVGVRGFPGLKIQTGATRQIPDPKRAAWVRSVIMW
jgi:hypothetical protein